MTEIPNLDSTPLSQPQPQPKSHNKPCTLCSTPRPVLVRCQIDSSQKWHFVCPGKCWTSVSGGVEDAKGLKGEFPWYRYGGMWKNRHEDGPVSARKPGKVKKRQRKMKMKQGNGEKDGEVEQKNFVGEEGSDLDGRGSGEDFDRRSGDVEAGGRTLEGIAVPST